MDESEISDFDVAIIGAIKTVIEVLASKQIATHDEFGAPFRHQMQKALSQHDGHAAGVFQVLADFCDSRGSLHALHKTPPQGMG